MQGIVGRDEQRERIGALIEDALAGRAGVLALCGEPGIGKSALLAEARELAAGRMTVLSAAGSEGESEIPYAALHGLAAPVLDRLSELPERQRAALEGALAVGPAEGADRLAIGAALIGLLDAAADVAPLLVLVDDAHWLDGASADALLFAARRLAGERIAMLLAVREGEGDHLDLAAVEQLALRGLPREPASRLIARTLDRDPPGEVVDALLAATAGNPLALLELPRSVDLDRLAAGDGGGDEPPELGERLRSAFSRRVERLPADTRSALLVAAAASSEQLGPVATAAAALGTDLEALGPAETGGLVELTGDALRFRHPLVRAAVYHGAPPPKRRRAHAALAAAEPTPARRAWHLAAAATGPDVQAAAALEQAGLEALARGGHGAAARALQRAAALTPAAEDRARRLSQAAVQWLVAGSMERSGELAREALEQADDPRVQAEAEQTLSRLEVMGGSLDAAQALALSAARRLERADPERAVLMLLELQTTFTLAARLADSRATSERAFELAAGGPLEDTAALMVGTELLLAGEFDAGQRLVARWPALGVEELVAAGPPLFFAMTLCLMWTGDYDSALAHCEATIAASRERGAAAPLQMALGQRAELNRRLGNWARARADAEESMRLAAETGQLVQGLYPYVVQLRLEAALGLDEQLARVGEVHALAAATGVGSLLAYLSAGEMLAALGRGDVAVAVERGRHTRGLLDAQGMRHPSVIQWRADLVEALVRAGETAEAEAETKAFAEQAEPTGQAWPMAAALRCRGLTASDAGFAEHFEAALEWHARGADPYERARTQLAYGERLRRAKRPSEAREHLRAALATFETLEADPWARRARNELRASGAAAPPSRGAVSRELTAQELEVALLVGGGATNREAAATLFLSPKTVEAHLSRIYRKLDVRSRTQLAALMGGDRPSGPV